MVLGKRCLFYSAARQIYTVTTVECRLIVAIAPTNNNLYLDLRNIEHITYKIVGVFDNQWDVVKIEK